MQPITPNDVNNYAQWFWQRFDDPFWIRRFPLRHAIAPLTIGFGNLVYEWDYRLIPNGTAFGALGGQNVSVQLSRLLVETGIAVTPAAHPLTDFRAGFAVVRYAEYFRAAQQTAAIPLLLNNDPALRSSRFKACMAEELASGIACYLLREFLDVVHIIDYQVWRDLNNQQMVGQRPDYYCITSAGEALLIEVKGSISTRRSTMTGPRATARNQLNNGQFGAEPVRPNGSRYSIASNLRVRRGANPRSISYIEEIVQQPVTHVGTSPSPPPVAPDRDPVLLSYAKILRYVGLDNSAERLLRKEPTGLDALIFEHTETYDNEQFSPIGFDPFGNLLMLETTVINDLNEGRKPKTPTNERKIHRTLKEQATEKPIFSLNDSIVVCPNPSLLGADPKRL